MIQFLLKFLGVKVDAAQEVTSVSIQLRNGAWLGSIVSIALLLAVFSWWAYRYLGGHRNLLASRRRVLSGLRVALFLLGLFMLLRPVFSFTVENRLRRTLMVLIDDSASMDIEDNRIDDADLKRAETATGKGADDVRHIARLPLVNAALTHDGLLEKLSRGYDLDFYRFNRTVVPASQDEALKAGGDDEARQATAIGDAIRDVTNRKRGQPNAGLFLVTDGGNNTGSEPLEAAMAAARDKMPLYVYGVGVTSPRDIVVESVFTPDVAFIKDDVPVTVRVRGLGLKGQTARLSLKLGDQEVASKEVSFGEDGEQAVPLTFTPQTAGEFDLTATIPPRDDEAVKDNNTATQRLRVIDSKIKVLFVENAPRWEFRLVQSVLERDRRIEAKFLLLQGDPKLPEAPGSPYLDHFPRTREELFKYDLVMIGDVPVKTFTPEQMDSLHEFVSKFGGAIAFIAGQQFDPNTYSDTPLAKLLPIEIAPAGGPQQTSAVRPTPLALTSQGLTSPMLRLSPDESENAGIWKGFPPVLWVNRVVRAKPAAQVLLEDTDPAKMTRFGRMPAMALQQYGLGQSLYMGTDDTWRWRQEAGVAYYPLLWGQIVQRMALAHLLGGSKRVQLSADKQRYNTMDRVTVIARLYDENFDPLKESSVAGSYSIQAAPGASEAPKQSVQLRPIPDQPGMYRGDFVATSPGAYQFSVDTEPRTKLEFAVTKSRFELGDSAMNEPLLKEMARVSGGAFFREENLALLPEKLAQKDERLSRVVDADIWSSPFYFLLVTGTVVSEWVLRKRSELK